MAVRWAIASGNFSSTSTWNDGVVLGIPTTGDDVFTNGFTVAMDTNATVNSLNNTARARTIATPQMTANNAPSPYVAAASSVGSGQQPWTSFDRATGNGWQANATTGWISMDFGSGSSIVIDAYTIFGSGTQSINPRIWTFEGSNNNFTWTVLHTVTLPSAIAASSSYSSGSIGNTTGYRYYRVNITLNGGNLGVLQLNELELYQPGTAALAAGGSFNFNTAGVTVSVTSVSQGATSMMTVTHTTGNVNINVSSSFTIPSGLTTISYTGNGNLILTCPNVIGIANAVTNTAIINKTSSGLATINGNLIQPRLDSGTAAQSLFVSNNGNTIINGNILGNPSPTYSGNPVYVISQTAGNLTINGNITHIGRTTLNTSYSSVFFQGTTLTLNGNTQGGDGLAIVSSGTVNVTGNLVGGNSVYANNTITINVTGDVYAGLQPAINCSAFTSSTVNLTGNMYNTLGRMAIWCPNVFISNTATTLWRMDTGGGQTKTLYSADSTPNLPATTNVRNGVTFGPALSLTGTMVVPSASDVRENVPVDNTVGTGELTSADIISGINASSDPLAVRLKNTLTDTTAGNIISQYNNS
jgi:hypothetical protein